MRRVLFAAVTAVALVWTTFAGLSARQLAPAPATPRWNADVLGNHRAVVRVAAPGTVARVVIEWRRPDPAPATRHIVVVDERRNAPVRNVRRGAIDRERGELWFEPTSGPGRYFVYYLPYRSGGRANYPTVTYPEPEQTADAAWLQRIDGAGVVDARVEALESIDEFNAFGPMQTIATAAEMKALLERHPGAPYLVFPEDRLRPIRMTRDLPMHWATDGPASSFSGEARRGEYFAFQFGIYALQDLRDVRVQFTPLTAGAASIASDRMSCLNTDGIDWNGRPLKRTVDVARQHVQALWCGAEIPVDASPGRYTSRATISADGLPPTTVALAFDVTSAAVTKGGEDEPWKQTRLRWLNSTHAQRNDVVPPYTPLRVDGEAISLLGRRVVVGAGGLPASIQTFFTPEMTSVGATPNDVLAAPMALVAEGADRRPIAWRAARPTFTEQSPGTVRWTSTATAGALDLQVTGALEFDGFVSVRMTLSARETVSLADVRLQMPYTRGASTYMMGLGRKGARRPSAVDWRWDVATRNQDGAWIGGVNAGLYFSLRGDNYIRPLNTNFYLQRPLLLPPSWGNDGRGGIRIEERAGDVLVSGFSGPRVMKAGEVQHFDVVLIVTPFHPIDTDFQWRTRFYHRYKDIDEIRATGATVVNIHHATPINPWINYPFIAHREMKAYIDEAHRKGLKVKIYNTIRELSNRAYEMFPLRSLGHEVFSPGPGGGFSWLQEHLGEDYIAAWFVPAIKDAAVVNSGMSRWHNYYVEGMRWLVDNVGIDGIYIDDVAFDRTTMKRIKRVLTANGHPGIVDFHSANQFNPRDGFINSAVLYLEHFPYVNRLWFGEYFDYERNSPDFFLTEVSGIPFGLMGEMLEGGGNPWRGMVYGMTNRMPWTENADPRPIWKAWDAFGMEGTRMIGYWVESTPVTTSRPDVKATVYAKPGRALVALASWADADVDVRLTIDWAALGIDPAGATIRASDIRNYQPARVFVAGESIPVKAGRGWLLEVRGRTR